MNLKTRFSLILATALLAAGCSTADKTPTASAPKAADPSQGCSSSAVEHLEGKVATPELLEEARAQAGAISARVLTPDSVVTLEYNGQRLNLYVDDQDVITRASCG